MSYTKSCSMSLLKELSPVLEDNSSKEGMTKIHLEWTQAVCNVWLIIIVGTRYSLSCASQKFNVKEEWMNKSGKRVPNTKTDAADFET